MAERKRSNASRAAVWIIVGLLMFGMVGFGAAGLSGTARSIGSVGDKSLSVTTYYNALNNDIAQAEQQFGRPLSLPEIQAFGIDRNTLARVVANRALDHNAAELGVSVGDARVRDQIVEIPAFGGLTGNFDRAAYSETLSRNGLSESEFETSLREDMARDILRQSVVAGVETPSVYAETLVGFLSETRDFSWARITEENLTTGLPVATDADLQAFYSENEDAFTSPEAKKITYIWITPDMVLDQVEIADADLRAIYEERTAEFNQPEVRLVERLIYPDAATATAALAEITAGNLSFEDAVAARGLIMTDVDLGDVSARDLGDASAAVFAEAEPGTIGPLETNLGPALFRINAIIPAQSRSFEVVKSELKAELSADRATRMIANMVDPIDDLLAGGATLEEAADETDMQLATLDWVPGTDAEIAAYTNFQSAAGAVTLDDFPQLGELSDGGLFALRLDETVLAALQDFEVVKAEVEAGWNAQSLQVELTALAENIASQLTGDVTLASLGYVENVEEDMERAGNIEGTSPALIPTVFGLPEGGRDVLQEVDSVLVLQLNAVRAGDLQTDESQALIGILNERLSAQLATDLFQAYANAVQADVDVSLNAATIQSVNSQIRGATGQN